MAGGAVASRFTLMAVLFLERRVGVHQLQLGKRVRERGSVTLAVNINFKMKAASPGPITGCGLELGWQAGVRAPNGEAEGFQFAVDEFGYLFLPCQIVMRHRLNMGVEHGLKPCRELPPEILAQPDGLLSHLLIIRPGWHPFEQGGEKRRPCGRDFARFTGQLLRASLPISVRIHNMNKLIVIAINSC